MSLRLDRPGPHAGGRGSCCVEAESRRSSDERAVRRSPPAPAPPSLARSDPGWPGCLRRAGLSALSECTPGGPPVVDNGGGRYLQPSVRAYLHRYGYVFGRQCPLCVRPCSGGHVLRLVAALPCERPDDTACQTAWLVQQ